MAVRLNRPSDLLPIQGIRLASTAAGIRYQGRDDLVLMEIAPTSQVAAVFTRNAFCAAPVTVAKQHLAEAPPRYLLINAGNANAGMGSPGVRDALTCCRAVAEASGIPAEQVLPFSTGVIGARLPTQKIKHVLPELMAKLSTDGWSRAAQAIMTTDTVAKGISRIIDIKGTPVTVTGIAKGAGMIRPDMATMLAFIATDAGVSREQLDALLLQTVAKTFNCITVEGDTSTNDACALIATGQSSVTIDAEDPEAVAALALALLQVMMHLAQAIVRDGEGATKFITVQAAGASSEAEARQVAYTVAHSPLVKTAFYASDPNWGRILAAVGRAGVERLDIKRVDISLDDLTVVRAGEPAARYTEAEGQAVMRKPEITVRIDLKRGSESAQIWTTDLSHEYVSINAEYRS